MNELERIRNIRIKLSIAKEEFEKGNISIEEFESITNELKEEVNRINQLEINDFLFKKIFKG
ncbi:MAG: hypothetical protein QM535_11495 [Limnohabitans sp.]|nr:hypothetical protein [Limnohabitans sp.]